MLAAGYLRVSTEEQAEHGISIPAQKSRIIAYCQSQGWDLFDFYIDDGYSGKNLERPAMKKLITDANHKKFQVIVVIKLDRLSRSQKDVLYLLEDVFAPVQIGFKSVSEPFDTTIPFGKAAIGMMAVFAQLERETIVERVTMAKREAAKQGRYGGGPSPYGYDYHAPMKELTINELQAETVRKIYARYLQGDTGYQAISDRLNEEKVPAPKAKYWNRSTIIKILQNPIYAGYLPHKGDLYEGKQAALISREDFEKVQKLLADRKPGTFKRHSGLISGLVYCAECGARMRTKNVWQNYPEKNPKKVIRYYVCYSQDGSTPYMVKDEHCQCGYKQADQIDQKVIEELMHYSLNPALIHQVILKKSSERSNHDSPKALAQTRKELETIQKKINRWYEAFEKESINPDELKERVKELREKKLFYETKIAEYEQEQSQAEERKTNVTLVVQALKNFEAIWAEATRDEQRSILVNLIQSVHVTKDDRIHIQFLAT